MRNDEENAREGVGHRCMALCESYTFNYLNYYLYQDIHT